MASMGSCRWQKPFWQSGQVSPFGINTTDLFPQGPQRAGVVAGMGQKSATVGVPTAAAKCMVPVEPDKKTSDL